MEGMILNREFQAVCVIDAFESFIWTNRYREPGDFELYMPAEKAPLEHLIRDNYVWRRDTDRLMIIEDLTITSDAEQGPHILVEGRSLESILDRRVVFERTIINGNLQNGIHRILNENFISPADSSRRIPQLRLIFNNDPRVTKLTCELNLLGENVLDVVQDLCETNDLGFQITFNEEDEMFEFKLYYGEDRSYDQDTNPWVVFSPNYDNLVGSNYYESYRELRTAAVIAGDANYERGQEVVDVDEKTEYTGLDRREMYVDGSDVELPNPTVNEESIRERWEKRGKSEFFIQNKIDEAVAEAVAQTTAVYRQQLMQKGREELAKTYITKSFEGEIEAVRQYVYDRDFFIGDVVQIRDQFGKEASSRITEIVMSHDVSGEVITPTFTTLLGGANEGDVPQE